MGNLWNFGIQYSIGYRFSGALGVNTEEARVGVTIALDLLLIGGEVLPAGMEYLAVDNNWRIWRRGKFKMVIFRIFWFTQESLNSRVGISSLSPRSFTSLCKQNADLHTMPDGDPTRLHHVFFRDLALQPYEWCVKQRLLEGREAIICQQKWRKVFKMGGKHSGIGSTCHWT